MLKLNQLSVGNDNIRLIEDFTYSFEDGHIYGIVAPNGSGKTTLFRTLVNLIPSISGTITLDDDSMKKAQRQFFYFESSEWFDRNLSGLDYLSFYKNMYHSKVSIDSVISYFSMEGFIKKPIKKYSLGMKQKVLFSLYLISDSKLLLMDEITNGLDESSRSLLFAKLEELKNMGKIIIITSHYLEDIENYCDTVLKLSDQKIGVV